ERGDGRRPVRLWPVAALQYKALPQRSRRRGWGFGSSAETGIHVAPCVCWNALALLRGPVRRLKRMGAYIDEAALRLKGEIMADRPQGTTQEPGRMPAADRPSDMREQGRDRVAQVQDRAQEMGTQVRDWAQEKGSQIKEGAQEAMQQVGTSVSQLAESSSQLLDRS